MEKKRGIIILVGALISTLIIGISCVIAEARNNEDVKIRKEEEHSMLVNVGSIVKLDFDEEYHFCKDKKGKKKECGNHLYNVTNYELMDNDAKSIFKGIDLKDKKVYRAILMICEAATSKKVDIKNIEITTDSKTISDSEVLKYLKENAKNKVTYTVKVIYKKNIEESTIKEEKKSYIVKFNSDGGNSIVDQNVEEGGTVTKPVDPTREGYKFVGWYLGNNVFDFNTPIENDITLEAMWQKQANNTTQNRRPSNSGTSGGGNTGGSQGVEASPEPTTSPEASPEPAPTPSETQPVPEETQTPEATTPPVE